MIIVFEYYIGYVLFKECRFGGLNLIVLGNLKKNNKFKLLYFCFKVKIEN